MRAKSTKKVTAKKKKSDEFIEGANYADLTSPDFVYPWEDPKLDKTKSRKLTLNMPEEYALKLDFLNKNTVPKLIRQRFILENIIPIIDKEITKIIK